MILLTDEEIKKHIDDWFLRSMDAIANGTERPDQIEIANNLAKAQLKRVYDWLNESCNHLDAVNWRYRFSCPVCRLALEDEVKE